MSDEITQPTADLTGIQQMFQTLLDRITALETKVDARWFDTQPSVQALAMQMEGMETRLNARIDQVRIGLEQRIESTRVDLEQRIEGTRVDLEHRIENTRVGLEQKIENTRVGLEQKIESARVENEQISKEHNTQLRNVNHRLGYPSEEYVKVRGEYRDVYERLLTVESKMAA